MRLHTLGYGVAGGIVLGGVYLHARSNFFEALFEGFAVFVQLVEALVAGQIVLDYHSHFASLLDIYARRATFALGKSFKILSKNRSTVLS